MSDHDDHDDHDHGHDLYDLCTAFLTLPFMEYVPVFNILYYVYVFQVKTFLFWYDLFMGADLKAHCIEETEYYTPLIYSIFNGMGAMWMICGF